MDNIDSELFLVQPIVDHVVKTYCRYYQIAEITLKVESDLPITDFTFATKFKSFQIEKPPKTVISIRHFFSFPDIKPNELGEVVYRKSPWVIYRNGDRWIYLGMSPTPKGDKFHCIAFFNHDYSCAQIYNADDQRFKKGNLHSLSMFPSDQIFLAHVLADREACYFHASGAKIQDKGYLFVGPSNAGKSTIVSLLKGKAEILSDDRIIVRRNSEGFRLHGTWSHGEVPDVSSESAPIRAIFFLYKSKHCRAVPMNNKLLAARYILTCMIKPYTTVDWWEKSLFLIQKLIQNVPFYSLFFDRSSKIFDIVNSI